MVVYLNNRAYKIKDISIYRCENNILFFKKYNPVEFVIGWFPKKEGDYINFSDTAYYWKYSEALSYFKYLQKNYHPD